MRQPTPAQGYPSQTLRAARIYSLKSSSTARSADTSPHQRPLKNVKVVFTEDRAGDKDGAGYFDGKAVVDIEGFLLDGPFSVSIWAKYDEIETRPYWWNNCIWAQDNGGGVRVFQLSTRGRRVTWHRMRDDDLHAKLLLRQGHWYHFAAVFDGDYHRLFVNGVLPGAQAERGQNLARSAHLHWCEKPRRDGLLLHRGLRRRAALRPRANNRRNQCPLSGLGRMTLTARKTHLMHRMQSLVCVLLILIAGAVQGREWPYYAADAKSSKYAPLSQIDGDNFARLQEVWRFTIPDKRNRRDARISGLGRNKGTPLVIDGVLYYGSPFNVLSASRSRQAAQELWTFDPQSWKDYEGDLLGTLRAASPTGESGDKKRIFYGTASLTASTQSTSRPASPTQSSARAASSTLGKGLRRRIDRSRYCRHLTT